MRRRVAASLAVAVALTCGGCRLSLQGLPKPGGISGPHYEIQGVFRNVLGLPDGAEVRLGDVEVGRVQSISTRDFRAYLELAIHDGVKLPVGTTAEVRFDTPLGDDFVELTPPPGTPTGFLRPGDQIGEDRTSTAPSVEDTFAALSAVLNGGGISKLNTIITEVNKALSGHQEQARLLIENLDATVAELAAHRHDIDRAITSLRTLTVALRRGDDIFRAAIDEGAPAAHVLADQTAQFTRLLGEVNRLSHFTLGVVRTSGDTTVRDIHEIEPLVRQLVALRALVGPGFTDIARFAKRLPTAVPGDYLQLSVLVHGVLGGSQKVPKKPPVGNIHPSPSPGGARGGGG
ncbi:MAG: MCE family protein [Frankiaceae bacterium]|nr:MCE family protein [Frankiaceae bacterium]MBV9871370.1 MCE family protein [Frankiaceae bacterium]